MTVLMTKMTILKRRNNIDEIWKPVAGFEGYYKVSNLGRIMSIRTGLIRKLVPNRQNGYLVVVLHGDNFKKTLTVHRIVAMAFCEKPNGCDFVNHKNEDKHDNRADNLEWCTKQYNNTYNGKIDKCCKAVVQMDEDYNPIRVWKSLHEAGRELGIAFKNISTVCRGLRPRAGGYRWKFIN